MADAPAAASEEGEPEVKTLQLRRQCKELGLDHTGSRADLLARLSGAADREVSQSMHDDDLLFPSSTPNY